MILLFLIIGTVGGFFAVKFAFKNDAFAMNTYANGEIDITIGEDGDALTYTELGAKCVAFGKDVSNEIVEVTLILYKINYIIYINGKY